MSKKVDGKGLRFNSGKLPIELIPTSFLKQTAAVLQKGAEKYAPRNWERGMSWQSVYGCLMRHLIAWQDGKELDDETGLPHLAHAACNLAFLIEYAETCPDLDDRPRKEK